MVHLLRLRLTNGGRHGSSSLAVSEEKVSLLFLLWFLRVIDLLFAYLEVSPGLVSWKYYMECHLIKALAILRF